MITILEAAKQSDLTKQKVRYWIDLLKIPITKKERKFYIPASSVNLLIAMKESIYAGLSPSLAANEVLNTFATPEASKGMSCEVKDDNRLDGLEKAIMLLVESNRKLSEENLHLKAQNATILSKLNTLSINLLPTKKTKAFKAWQPPIKHPIKASFIKRLWLELFNPESLRTAN